MSRTVLSHLFKVDDLNLPIITDKYYLLDLTYFLVCDTIKYNITNNLNYIYINDDTFEYIDSILEDEDKDLLSLINDKIIDIIISKVNDDDFLYLKDYEGEILNVYYRYVKEERYVKFFIELE